MVETFVLGLMALVYGESHEFISRTRELIDRGRLSTKVAINDYKP